LQVLLKAVSVSIESSPVNDVKWACEMIMTVQALESGERDCIRASFKKGPLFDGDVPSKSSRDSLLKKGLMAKVVVSGEDGYNACTNKGAWAFRLMEAGA
jgi:hypothetical protein